MRDRGLSLSSTRPDLQNARNYLEFPISSSSLRDWQACFRGLSRSLELNLFNAMVPLPASTEHLDSGSVMLLGLPGKIKSHQLAVILAGGSVYSALSHLTILIILDHFNIYSRVSNVFFSFSSCFLLPGTTWS